MSPTSPKMPPAAGLAVPRGQVLMTERVLQELDTTFPPRTCNLARTGAFSLVPSRPDMPNSPQTHGLMKDERTRRVKIAQP